MNLEELEKRFLKLRAKAPKSRFACEKCKDSGFIIVKEGLRESAMICECKVKKDMEAMLENSGLRLSLFKEQTFERFTEAKVFQTHMKRTAMAFCEQEAYPFFFAGGQVGCGKTHICTAICGFFYEKGRPFKYEVYEEMISKLKAVVTDDLDYTRYLNRLCNVSLLYIDDLFKGKGVVKDTDIRHLFKIINRRYVNRRMTLISSEKTLEEILAIDEGIGSRIKQMCGDFCVSIGRDIEKNYRL